MPFGHSLSLSTDVRPDHWSAPPSAGLEDLHRTPGGDKAIFLYVPFLFGVLMAFSASVDDPFITLRYAANVVHGLGAVFNLEAPTNDLI